MNFFQAQKRAKKRTLYLIFAFILGVIAILVVVNAFILTLLAYYQKPFGDNFMLNFSYQLNSSSVYIVSISILIIVAIGTLYQYNNLKSGKSVALDLGAKLIFKDTKDHKERVLLNVVEEMSLASGVPPPATYLLNDNTINAFASGFSIDDAIICVTKGALDNLTRQELQGVIAHEFSHIFNGDMNLFMKTSSIIHGILALGIIGKWIVEVIIRSNGSRRKSSKDSGGILLFLLVLGVGLVILGYFGMFIGSIIKASISRQREYNADATAVKYTRDTTGIANALKRIYAIGSRLQAPNADTYSHFYFAQGIANSFTGAFLSTHPPLKDRILRIEPDWDGSFKIQNDNAQKRKSAQKEKAKKERLKDILTTGAILDALDNSGVIKDKNIQKATNKIKQIPRALHVMTDDAFSARGLILALLSSDINEVPQSKLNEFANKNPKLFRQIRLALNSLADLQKDDYLTLLLLSLPSLKQMSKEQYLDFRNTLIEWIWENQKMVFFEWIIKRVIIIPLDIYYGLQTPKKERYNRINSLKNEIEFFISFLCLQECQNTQKAKELFAKTLTHANLQRYEFLPQNELNYEKLGKSLDILTLANAKIRKQLFQMAIYIYSDNNTLSTKNNQMLHALSIGLKIPLPYM